MAAGRKWRHILNYLTYFVKRNFGLRLLLSLFKAFFESESVEAYKISDSSLNGLHSVSSTLPQLGDFSGKKTGP